MNSKWRAQSQHLPQQWMLWLVQPTTKQPTWAVCEWYFESKKWTQHWTVGNN
jgi:hypothetical protein